MLKLKDAKDRTHIIAHLSVADIPALETMRRRFNGELALWSASHHEWVPVAELDVGHARETNVEIVTNGYWEPKRG